LQSDKYTKYFGCEEELHGKIDTHGNEFLQQQATRPLVLLIDALDECANAQDVIRFVSKGFLKQEVDLSSIEYSATSESLVEHLGEIFDSRNLDGQGTRQE
jgi:hypothetical protein